MMDVDSAEEASPSLLRQGDLRVLLSLLHSAGSELHPALLALLFRLLLLPHPGSYVHGSSVVLPQLHDAHGIQLGPRPTPLAECLRCQLLSFDDETLEGWLGGQARRGPPCGTRQQEISSAALDGARRRPSSSRHTARMWGVLGMSKCSVRTSVSVRRRALSTLLGHGVLGHEPLSVCEVA